jgi:predicted ATPase
VPELVYRRNKDGTVITPEGPLPANINVGDEKLFIGFFETVDTEKVKKIFNQARLLPSDVGRLRAPSIIMQGSEFRTDQISSLVSRIMKDQTLYDQFFKIVKNLMPSLADFREIKVEGPKVKGSEYLLLMQEKSLQRELSTRSLSEGDLRTLAIIATALEMPENSSFFIEEIENGMHPARAEKLVEQLDTFSKVKNIQIVFTTHSPLVINELKAHNVVFVTKNGTGSKFKLLSETEDISQIKELLKKGVSLSDYLSAKLVKHE